MGETATAVALLAANAADYPESATAAFGLGRAYETAGQTAEARREYQRALAIDPEHRRAAAARVGPQ
jgi:Tfp pilus assembly protein PilF